MTPACLRIFLTLGILISGFWIAPASAYQPDFEAKYSDISAIDRWVEATFTKLSYNKYVLHRGTKVIVIIIGQFTFGLESNEISVFEKQENDEFDLMLARRRVVGHVTVKEMGDEIVFSARSPVLVVPWAGVGDWP